jgi:hypothetical protein
VTRERWIGLLVTVAAAALVIWVANNSYWADEKMPLPLKGEAARNPFCAVQRFAQALGAHAQWSQGTSLPSSSGVVLISDWNWQLTSDRSRRIEHWVESGGRLVVDNSLIGGTGEFERWSGIGHQLRQWRRTEAFSVAKSGICYTVNEAEEPHSSYSVCGMQAGSSLTTTRAPSWALRNELGVEVARVKVGRGSVTVINGTPFAQRGLLDHDNGALFVAATQLRRGDQIHFFSEGHHASLLQLAWQLGWPALYLSAVLLALALWRGGARFGPLAAPAEMARRSLAEQIRGTGEFAMRVGSGQSLHAAARRALNEVATRYIRAYDRLGGAERMRALAEATGLEGDALAAAFHYSGSGRMESVRAAIELLESARRRVLISNARSRHGNRT